ncbi:MAG TPA: AbrB/MazE/SpoVT family DNA-binding domain-containing protein [Rickettsia endosymbiont of Sericostoma sp.]|uniref:AbrB/MazE/SpoVT family DNA-binding domain-containing protein n=1 Tax=unclassified Candidatus Tisiphia TaxID=2996318 RepID=UPI001E02AF1B|nr:AbrB/MazE/SpoVT family DNA-binding domain-containing protein [Rickettsia endosymbiont of Sericostoma sp. HW-2014]HJD64342.1 AbrB/MazE/SpoVT family DNA-binding domain-containing protein [Rickettsia endosymbiont of Sericostoma sp.]
MEKLITSMDQHGRVLIPSEIRGVLNIQPGDKVNLEIYKDEVKIISANKIIDEMHAIFIKNQTDKKDSVVDDFINKKHEEYQIEELRNIKNG